MCLVSGAASRQFYLFFFFFFFLCVETSHFLVGSCEIFIVPGKILHSKKSNTGYAWEEKLSSHRYALAWFGAVNAPLPTGKQQHWYDPAECCLIELCASIQVGLFRPSASAITRCFWRCYIKSDSLHAIKNLWHTFTLIEVVLE